MQYIAVDVDEEISKLFVFSVMLLLVYIKQLLLGIASAHPDPRTRPSVMLSPQQSSHVNKYFV